MAVIDTDKLSQASSGFGNLPLVKQLGVIIGLAVCVAAAMYVYEWAQTPNYRPVFSNMQPGDAAKVMDALNQAGISTKLNTSGVVMVPGSKIHQARTELASKGVSGEMGMGYELLNQDSSFGTSQFMERARFLRAMEGELARTITSFISVRAARVHIATPKQSSFIRNQGKTSASVFVDLYAGHSLDRSQVAAIVNLVASSVPGLSSNLVTLVDQNGALLTEADAGSAFGLANRQLDYQNQLEQILAARIVDMLSPIIGAGKVRAQVAADIDFTQYEQSQETYDPDMAALRSEQSIDDQRTGSAGAANAGGVPGALAETETTNAGSSNNSTRKVVTKNFELDKAISYTRSQVGRIKSLSVAVLVDNMPGAEGGEAQALSEEELTKVSNLVKNIIGYSDARGDRIEVINTAFVKPEPIEELPPPSLMEQPWVWDVAKQAAGGLFLLILLFGVIRPMLKNLIEKAPKVAMVGPGGQPLGADFGRRSDQPSYDDQLKSVQQLAHEDPSKVAHVVQQWVDE